jgi:hypothetical protein
MSILTGFKKVKNYILTSSGYQLLSRWTSSQTVEFDDGKTAQTKLGEINGIAKTYVDMKKATDNSMVASAKAVMEGLENSSALISMTQAEYDALSDEEKTDNNMRAILDANPDVIDAKNVNYDNTNTNLTATNTQSAITELNGKLNDLKFASISTSITLLVSSRQSLIGSLSDFKLPSDANIFAVSANCDWPVNVRVASNGNFYAYQIANVSNDAVFALNFIVAYK